MKTAIVHDWLTNFGGSERCVQAFLEIYPASPLYTSIWDKKKVTQFGDTLTDDQVMTSFLQRFPFSKSHHAFYLYLMPLAFEGFDFSEFDVILTSSHACAKGIITQPDSLHICYCHTPTRYFWDFWHKYISNPSYFGIFNLFVKLFAPFLTTYLRVWDRTAVERVDHFIANSSFIAQRIQKYYRKESTVIYPPVDIQNFHTSSDTQDYFLLLSRLVPYKKADLAIDAFNELGLPLKIIGNGPEYKNLRSKAKGNIEFLGEVPEQEKYDYFAKCQAFIFPPEEDFGITAVEAMAAGRPVIAYGKGGALETVVDGKTGLFFQKQTKEDLIDAVKKFDPKNFDTSVIRQHALQFDRQVFKSKIKNFIDQKYKEKFDV